jgi:hypothetical protein
VPSVELDRNQMALLITFCAALFIAFVATLGVSADWVKWLLAVLLLIYLLIQEQVLFTQIDKTSFDSTFWFAFLSIFVFTLFMLGEVGRLNIQIVSIISYILGGLFALTLIYAFVRNFQQ